MKTAPSARVRLESSSLAAAAYDERRQTLQLDFREECAICIPASRRSCIVSCSAPVPKDSFLTDTFATSFLM
jgi:hypothetical protein